MVYHLKRRTIEYYVSKNEIKDCSIMIDANNFFDQRIKSDIRTYNNTSNISTGQGDDYTTGSFLDYNYFNEHY